MARLVSAFLFLLVVLVREGSVFAQLPVARLLTVFPSGGKIGSQFEVGLTGADLDEANQLHFSHTGITAKQKLGVTNGLPEANTFVITIGTHVSPANRVGGDPLVLPRGANQPIYHPPIPAERVAKLKAELAALKKKVTGQQTA